MAQIFIGYPIISKTGANITTGAASADITIPLDSSGNVPRYLRLSATAACTFRTGSGAQTAVATDCQIQPGDSLIISLPGGHTHIAAIQVTVAGQLNVTPLENS
jgi:hypothetical protein